MSFATPQPPSASSDSGSSASLTPTANGYNGSMSFADPSSSSASTFASTSASASRSLFSSEESKFITESLSSAESFDPFTIGAPGFKVPSLLPPNIASTHDHLAGPSTSSAGLMSDPTASPDMRPRTLSGQQPLHLAYPTASPQSDAYSNQTAAQRLNSFNLYGRQPSGATPPASGPSNPSYLSHLQENSAFAHPAGRHASFSGPAPGPMSPAAAAGYGKNKAWQMEQLSFLEAQASRGQQQQQFPQGVGMGGDPNRRSSTSMIGYNGPYDNILIQTPARLQQQQQQQMHQQQQQHQRPPFYPGVTDEQHAGLAMLGAQFPSSHNFGSMQQQASLYGYQQQQGGAFSAQALAMLNGDAGLGVASSFVEDDGQGGNSIPKGTSRTPTGNTDPKASRRASAAWPTTTTASASPSATALKRTSTGAPKTAPTQSSSLHTGPSGAVIRALADLASLDLDLATALHRLPANLHPYFTPTRMEKRTQPHLEMLRQQHIEDGLIDARTGLEIKPEPTEEDLKREAEEAEKEKKGQHTSLTTEEKKANHIASEQKRRANIRKGYEMLCDIVPALREALEREASSKGKRDGSNDESGSGAESGDEQGKKSKSPSKKKKSTSGSSKKDESGGCGGIEIYGEKIDGRAGPRSEAVVLMKSLDHTSALVEQYKGLLGRRNRARIAIARKMGWDGLAMQPVPDIDRLLAIKVQEWWASHGDEDGEEDEEEDRFGAAGGGGGGDDDDEGDEEEEEVAVEESKKKSPAKGAAGKKGGGQGRKKKSIKSESMED
ncbi:uncharacterized protein UBRO_07765 [Ustilago bromivora]|uniref:Uncharacterized protein n=1 Tax=Ustilago bromivora TaxID=307758 RepID=A0A1K0GWD0_9BASI|nr:uncharacterized protein UBRO_07765 [Ustilago bromivora]SYW78148.1 uncharacterized protein UBRO2_02340 [Ustilago bromivora]